MAVFELEIGSEVGTGLGVLLGPDHGLASEVVVRLGSVGATGLKTGAGFGLELEHVVECGLGIAVRPEFESGFVAEAGLEPGDGLEVGYEVAVEAEFGPETGPEAVTEPGADEEPEAAFGALLEMRLVPVDGTGVGPLAVVGAGLGTGPGAKF